MKKGLTKMSDPFADIKRALPCSFCENNFASSVKLIPGCGKFMCGGCYESLVGDLGESRKFKCRACGDRHTLPFNGMSDVTQLLPILRNTFEKPFTGQAKKLKRLVVSIEDELGQLEGFNAAEHIEQHCEQLEQEVGEAAESAVKHIEKIEKDLLKQIKEYRQRCLNALRTSQATDDAQEKQLQASSIHKTKNELEVFSVEVNTFNTKWNHYFGRLNALASDAEIEAAILHAEVFQTRMKELDREMSNSALNGSLMQFSANQTFLAERDHLGKLKNISQNMKESLQGKENQKAHFHFR